MSLTTVESIEAPIGTSAEEGAPGQGVIQGRTPLRLALARLTSDRLTWVAIGMIVAMALLAILAPLIASLTGHGPTDANLDTGTDATGQPLPPFSNGYFLGTDNLGRDIFVRIAYGAQISLLVGVASTLLATVVGVVLGMISGYFGGWIDAILARLMDIVLSFPYVLLAIALVSVYGPSLP